MVDFVAKTPVVIEYIKAKDLKKLGRQYLQLNDVLTRLEIDLDGNQMTDLDFFRFKKVLKEPLDAEKKRAFRKKFRRNVIKFYKQIKAGEAKRLPALEALKAYQDYKKAKRREYLELKKLVDAEVHTREVKAIETERSNLNMSKISEPEEKDENECLDAHTEMNKFVEKQKAMHLRQLRAANRAKGIGNSS
jgi:hypothetical protein